MSPKCLCRVHHSSGTDLCSADLSNPDHAELFKYLTSVCEVMLDYHPLIRWIVFDYDSTSPHFFDIPLDHRFDFYLFRYDNGAWVCPALVPYRSLFGNNNNNNNN